MTLSDQFNLVRDRSEYLCESLQTEDFVIQPIPDVSPPKWHLGHTSWFFETFLLKPYLTGYRVFDPEFDFVFNSYYESLGARVIRTNRGNLSRPTVAVVYDFRRYVNRAMKDLLSKPVSSELESLVILGLNHEEQHQELLATDVKYILGHNPLFPKYEGSNFFEGVPLKENGYHQIKAGIYNIGHNDNGFSFDNEHGRHEVLLGDYQIASHLVSNAEYLEFIKDGGYADHRFWHAEGLDWVRANQIQAPLYWHLVDGQWYNYKPTGFDLVQIEEPVCHVSFYEASAFASWAGKRLPTEFEWEIAADQLQWGQRWEWTNSAYLPYPNFIKPDGAIGEYNGKFMVNQMILRGASQVTPPGHSRKTYRNFFHPDKRWQFTGIRLAG